MNILESGLLLNNSNNKKEIYYVTKLDMSCVDTLFLLQKLIMRCMKRNDLYAGLTRKELINMLHDNGGIIIGAFVTNLLIGFYGIYFPESKADNLGRDIGIAGDDLISVAHLEGAGVHPSYTGNSLQKTLNKICLEQALKIRKIQYLCATVSPYNYPSIKHLFAAKLYIVDIREKYNGMLRYICARNINKTQKIDEKSIVIVDSCDIERQYRLLKEGLKGFELIKSGDTCFIKFCNTK